MVLSGGYSVATYVGFDDNRQMERKTTHITGASGALPMWTEIVNKLIYNKDFGGSVDLVDHIFSRRDEVAMMYPDLGQIEVLAAVDQGGVAVGTGQKKITTAESFEPVVTFGVVRPEGGIDLKRYFRPFWHLTQATGDVAPLPQ